MTTINDILSQYESIARDDLHKGHLFERMIRQYLLIDPQYAADLENIWLYSDWPDRPPHWPADNTGIDLIAKTRSQDFWAIQCKFYDPDATINKDHITSFTNDSSKIFKADGKEQTFAFRMFVSTTSRLGKQADNAIQDLPSFGVLYLKDLESAPVDWSQFVIGRPEDTLRLQAKKRLRDHQEDAIQACTAGFSDHDRGKLIMACGTGKTFTALKLAERLVGASGSTLFLAPSITLLSQTLREWSAEAETPFDAFVVCSDTKVGREEEDIRTADLAYPATTDARRLAQALQRKIGDRRQVVFSTYQSIQVVIDALRSGHLPDFDLVICDEAHRTTGLTLPGEDPSDFVKVHESHILRAKKRLYMTATPRIYADASKTKAGEKSAVLYSMDDEGTFGTEFYRLSFGQSVSQDLLAEYKVLIVAVDEDRMANVANSFNKAYKIDDKKAVDIGFATRIIGSWKGLSKQGLKVIDEESVSDLAEDTAPMRRAVAFSKSIKASQQATEVFADLVNLYTHEHEHGGGGMVNATLHHVDGAMNMALRKQNLDWLKSDTDGTECRILSNARCLSEGVDVPALDAVIFFDTRESIVDIVQSVGRVMRKAPGKQYGYIILPVAIPMSKLKDYNSYIESDAQFKGIWKVIKALRAHDERLVDEAEFRRRVNVIGGGERTGDGDGSGGEQVLIDFPMVPVDDIQQAVYAAIPKKLGDREYWSEWARDVARIADRLTNRIRELITRRQGQSAFNAYLKGLRKNINAGISEDEAIEMLTQHVITRPVFEALFEGYAFSRENPVAVSMQRIIEVLDEHEVNSEVEGLEKFYANVRERVSLAKSDKSRQEIIKNLYDTFFNNAFPRMAERLGIVYTPVEVVDFIVHSVDTVLRKHFGQSVGSDGVQIIDPFTGTGTFLVRLLQSELISDEDLQRKFSNEIHANEIVLLAYYIAAINIESAYHARKGEYHPFDGIVLTDTFQMYEAEQGDLENGFSKENAQRVEQQKRQPIRVVMSNPPYSAQQDSQNDNNQNLAYPKLDEHIRKSYAAQSSASNVKNLYDSYIRAIRWASDRIGNQGVVAFVTNGSFIDANNMDGLRKCLTGEYSHLYVFNLRGNQRTSGELSRKEGGKIFGSGSRTPVAITVMVKDPAHVGPCDLRYHDIGDYLTREEKLAIVERFSSIDAVPWQTLVPNAEGDWIDQRNPEFEGFIPLGNKESMVGNVMFAIYSLGVGTNRDAWAYNMSHHALEENMLRTIDVYNSEVDRYQSVWSLMRKEQRPPIEDFVERDPRKISWSSSLLPEVARGHSVTFDSARIVISMYRPFDKEWLYFDSTMNHRVGKWPRLFPTPQHRNVVISATGIGATKAFSTLVSSTLPDLEMISKGQCFPLYWYESAEDAAIRSNRSGPMSLFAEEEAEAQADVYGYIRHEAITDWALKTFRERYTDTTITKEDIFWYVYGLLHSPEYRERFASDLKKMLPRIPFAPDFRAFSEAGRRLGELHLDYETVEPWPLEEIWAKGKQGDYRVEKIRFAAKKEKNDEGRTVQKKDRIAYNHALTLAGIPDEAYEYVVNGKSAIEWVMERYSVRVDKDSGIVNDPNAWCEEHNDPAYIVGLLKRIVRVGVETVRIAKEIGELPIQ